MNFTLNPSLKLGIYRQNNPPKLNVSSADGTQATLSQTNDGSTDTAAVTTTLAERKEVAQIGKAKEFLGVAENASNAILDLRKLQLELAEEAEAQPAVTARHLTITDSIAEIQTEIDRVASSATYNGRSVFNSNEVNLDVYGENLHNAVITPSAANLTGSLSLDVSTAANAETSVDTLEDIVTRTTVFAANAASRLDYVDGVFEEEVPPSLSAAAPKTEATTTDIPTLSNKIADQVGSQFSTERSLQQLIKIQETLQNAASAARKLNEEA